MSGRELQRVDDAGKLMGSEGALMLFPKVLSAAELGVKSVTWQEVPCKDGTTWYLPTVEF